MSLGSLGGVGEVGGSHNKECTHVSITLVARDIHTAAIDDVVLCVHVYTHVRACARMPVRLRDYAVLVSVPVPKRSSPQRAPCPTRA